MVQKVFYDEAEPSIKMCFYKYSDTEFEVEISSKTSHTTLVLDYHDLNEIIKELERIKKIIQPF
jgi:hypothetical protein